MRCAEIQRGVRILLAAFLAVPVLACPGPPEDPPPEDPEVVDRPPEELAVCLRGKPFVADGAVPLAAGEAGARGASGAGEAHQMSALRWEAHEGCERFVIELADEEGNAAATPGEVRAEVLRKLGVVRVSLLDVEQVDPAATDARLEGSLAGGAYAVWSPEGRWVYVDLHLAGEAEAHAALPDGPARVVVDLRSGGGAVPEAAPAGRHVVVLDPRPGSAEYPLTVTGYARTFEANVVARIEREGERVEETFTTATAWVDAWGHYSLTFEEGPAGPIELHVGEYSAKDGTWEGVAVELEMRGRRAGAASSARSGGAPH